VIDMTLVVIFSSANCEIKKESTVKGKIAFASDRDGNGEIYIMKWVEGVMPVKLLKQLI